MKIILIGINSKYIHPNLAIRYLKVNSDFLVDIKEFTIKDNINNIYNNIIKENPNVIGLSVYIWNVHIINKLLLMFKKHPKIKIILGGPEVSYEYNNYLYNGLADYIIFNEGEIGFNMLLHSIIENKELNHIPNLAYIENNIIVKNTSEEISNLNSLNNPYHLDNEDSINKIQYVELSRGCPYQCSYCLASLEKKVRYFDINKVYENIKFLYSKGAKTFKFLDRTFNLKPKTAIALFKFIIEGDFHNAVFQFEISGDILSDEIISYLVENCPDNLIRFEIGIQSIHDKVNKAVYRNQNTEKLFSNIKRLQESNVILHLDLIAGLPYETLELFEQTFNSTFNLYARELQLGTLKLLKGTKLYYQRNEFGYKYDLAAPYEIYSNDYLDSDSMNTIKIVEESLELFWNKGFMNNSIKLIIQNYDSPFKFFLNLGKYYLNKYQAFHRYQLIDVFLSLEEFVKNNDLVYDIRYDYLTRHNIKPKIYWENSINKNDIIRLFHKNKPNYNLDKLYKYSLVSKYYDGYIIALYYPDKKEFHKIKA